MESIKVVNRLLEIVNLYQMIIKNNDEEQNNDINILLDDITSKLECCFMSQILYRIKERKILDIK